MKASSHSKNRAPSVNEQHKWIAATLTFIMILSYIIRWEQSESIVNLAVIYVFSPQDNSSLSNLQYFVRNGIKSRHGRTQAFFFIILQGVENISSLPTLPREAKYIPHQNICYDWGTLGWFLFQSGLIDQNQFDYFVFINSSVRGPFLPSYVKQSWLDIMLSLISPVVKLAGPTISCESTGQSIGRIAQNPHVQSYAMITDHTGLSTMFSAGVFTCRNDRWRTIFYGELLSSRSVLDAGYTIDSVMMRYRGIDWHDKLVWKCNGGISPLNSHSLDGTTASPLDVMFVKVKDALIENEVSSAVLAVKYDQWSLPQSPSTTVRNDLDKLKVKLIKRLKNQGSACFDSAFYLQENFFKRRISAFDHFVHFGQFEGRRFRYSC